MPTNKKKQATKSIDESTTVVERSSEVDLLRKELERLQLQNAELYRYNQYYQQQSAAQQFQQIQQPTIVVQFPNVNHHHNTQYLNIYLGGSINEDDWQKNVINQLYGQYVCIYNPRRNGWKPSLNQSSSSTYDAEQDNKYITSQLSWELDNLNKSNCAVFWFQWGDEDKNTASYLQLGSCSHSGKHVFVGIHSRYKDKKTLYEYIKTFVPNAYVTSSFNNLVTNLANWVSTGKMHDSKSSRSSSDDVGSRV
jgi:hypothetical protein